jgi:hypothetical protein
MKTYNDITPELEDAIELEMIHGYRDEDGKKKFPTIKSSAEWYNVSYDSLRKIAGKWDWKEKRKTESSKVARKTAQIKKSEEIRASEIEEIVVENFKFNKTANKLRRALDIEIDKIIEGNIYLYTTEGGETVYGTPRNAAYLLMNLGKSLVDAQKVSLTAKGEPSEISKVEGTIDIDERRERLKTKMRKMEAKDDTSSDRAD